MEIVFSTGGLHLLLEREPSFAVVSSSRNQKKTEQHTNCGSVFFFGATPFSVASETNRFRLGATPFAVDLQKEEEAQSRGNRWAIFRGSPAAGSAGRPGACGSAGACSSRSGCAGWRGASAAGPARSCPGEGREKLVVVHFLTFPATHHFWSTLLWGTHFWSSMLICWG